MVAERQRDRVRPRRWRRAGAVRNGCRTDRIRRVLPMGLGFGGAISWSPDGGRIAFDCGTTICAINPDGTNLVQLAPAGSNASTAIFSPVGGDIAFLTGWPARRPQGNEGGRFDRRGGARHRCDQADVVA